MTFGYRKQSDAKFTKKKDIILIVEKKIDFKNVENGFENPYLYLIGGMCGIVNSEKKQAILFCIWFCSSFAKCAGML